MAQAGDDDVPTAGGKLCKAVSGWLCFNRPAGLCKSRLTLIAFNLKRCQKNKELHSTGDGASRATVCDYLTLVRRTELHEMAPNVGLGISKQIVRTKRLELQIQAARRVLFETSGPAIRKPLLSYII